jgi:hypothetical protein
MALDAQPSPLKTRPLPLPPGRGATAKRPLRVRPSARAAVRRRFDEAALAAAIRELRTHRHSRVVG